jgi:hypothetical protein
LLQDEKSEKHKHVKWNNAKAKLKYEANRTTVKAVLKQLSCHRFCLYLHILLSFVGIGLQERLPIRLPNIHHRRKQWVCRTIPVFSPALPEVVKLD